LRRRGVITLSVGLVLVAGLVVTVVARGGVDPTGCGRAFVPAYMPPAQVEALSRIPGAGSYLIINPQNGPGAAAQPAYRQAVEAVQAAGWRVLGYVPTDYGARAAGTVRADASRYTSWYGVDGIFLDEVAAGSAQLAYYGALRTYIQGLVAINPGIVPARGYLAVADLIVTYEGPFSGYADAVAHDPAWLPRHRTIHLVYDAPTGSALSVATGHDGYSYTTSGTLPDPWSALPQFAEQELRDLGVCRAD
jgi:hypothetical protein